MTHGFLGTVFMAECGGLYRQNYKHYSGAFLWSKRTFESFYQKSALLEHLMSDISPPCNFDINTIKVIDKYIGDLKLRFAVSIHLKLGKKNVYCEIKCTFAYIH